MAKACGADGALDDRGHEESNPHTIHKETPP